MTEIGGAFTKTLSLSSGTFTNVSAPTGEQIKITMVYGKRQSDGAPRNADLHISPANGAENNDQQGTRPNTTRIPPVGANYNGDTTGNTGLQPIFMTDSDPLFVGSGAAGTIDVLLQGVRVA